MILKNEVENYKEDIVVDKEELIMKKEMKNKEILRNTTKISCPQNEREFWKAIEVNDELKLNVDEQKDDIILFF